MSKKIKQTNSQFSLFPLILFSMQITTMFVCISNYILLQMPIVLFFNFYFQHVIFHCPKHHFLQLAEEYLKVQNEMIFLSHHMEKLAERLSLTAEQQYEEEEVRRLENEKVSCLQNCFNTINLFLILKIYHYLV